MTGKSNNSEIISKDISLAENAYRQIKEDILRNKFPSGDFVSINDLSKTLEGMGRTPIREAVQRLHDERLLIVVPRRGIVIPEFDIKKMMDQLEVRYILEKYATIKASEKISERRLKEVIDINEEMKSPKGKSAYQLAKLNMEFHSKIVEIINNQELLEILNRMYDHHIRIYTHYLAKNLELRHTYADHMGIIEAIRTRDNHEVEKAVDRHYKSTRSELLDSLIT